MQIDRQLADCCSLEERDAAISEGQHNQRPRTSPWISQLFKQVVIELTS